jgi:hypothetical protein
MAISFIKVCVRLSINSHELINAIDSLGESTVMTGSVTEIYDRYDGEFGTYKEYGDRSCHPCRIDVPTLRGIFSNATDDCVTVENQVVRINPKREIIGSVIFYMSDKETIQLESELFEKNKRRLTLEWKMKMVKPFQVKTH